MHNWPGTGRDRQHYKSISVQKRLQMLYIARRVRGMCSREFLFYIDFDNTYYDIEFVCAVCYEHTFTCSY